MSKKEKEEIVVKESKISLKSFVVIFLFVYAFLQLGFTGLYTYTTWGVLFTCLMYFSIFTVMTLTYVFFKFRKNTLTEKEIKDVLKRMFKYVTVIIVVFSVCILGKYLYTMFGIKSEKENFNLNDKKVVAESKIENIVDTNNVEADSSSDPLNMLANMTTYNDMVTELDNVYTGMKTKFPAYLGFRILTDCIDVLITAGVIFIASEKTIVKIKLKEDKENKENKKEVKETKEK